MTAQLDPTAHGFESLRLPANGITVHAARTGAGRPLVLLHGWPEFWLTWAPLMARLARPVRPDRARPARLRRQPKAGRRAVRPGRARGARGRPAGAARPSGARRGSGSSAHDVGAYVAQSFAHAHPERLTRLFFFDCPYPGIGPPLGRAPRIWSEIWYQSFQQKPWAAALVGSSRAACRIYFGNMFLRHWAAGIRHAFDGAVLEAWVDNFLKPGNLQGGFDWYLERRARRAPR